MGLKVQEEMGSSFRHGIVLLLELEEHQKN